MRRVIYLLSSLLVLILPAELRAERPAFPKLLPDNTFLMLRIDHAANMRASLRESSIGKLIQDPQMRPFVEQLVGDFGAWVAEQGQGLGLQLGELIRIPHGEVGIALITLQPVKGTDPGRERAADQNRNRTDQIARRRGPPFDLLIVVDTQDQTQTVFNLLEQLERAPYRDDYEGAGRTRIHVRGRQPEESIAWAEREGTFVLSNNEQRVEAFLSDWEKGNRTDSLGAQQSFASAMTACLGNDAKEPQISFFFDPITLLRSVTNNSSIGLTLRLLDQFGLANLRGIGASVLIGAEKFDSMIHAHVVLDSPRDGVLAVLQPETGNLRPENWIPAEVSSYSTGRWNLARSIAGVERIVEKIAGSQYWEQEVEGRFRERFGVEMGKDVLQQLTGRGTMITWFEPPARLGSEVSLFAFEVKDSEAAQKSLETVLKKLNVMEEQESYGGVTMYQFTPPGRVGPGRLGRPGNNRLGGTRREGEESLIRRGTPMAMLLDKQLLVCDSRSLLQLIVRTNGSSDSPRLTSRPEFDLVTSEIHAALEGREPFYLSYNEPREALRSFYDLANSSAAKSRLAGIGDRFAPAGILGKALQDKPLPPFGVVASYFSVGGAAMYDEPTGIHYFSFTTRAEEFK